MLVRTMSIAIPGLVLLAGSAQAGTPTMSSCESYLLTAAAKYSQCRLKAVASATKTGTTADYTKCDTNLQTVTTPTKVVTKCPVAVDPAFAPALQDFITQAADGAQVLIAGGAAGQPPIAITCETSSTTTTTNPASTTTTVVGTSTTTSTTSPPQCPPGQTLCGANCVDTASDPNNCGACGNQCDTACTGNVGSTACSAGACSISSCLANHYDIDATCGNGCECTGMITGGHGCGTNNLGTLQLTQSTAIQGNVPQQGDVVAEEWYQVTFTSGGTPHISITTPGSPANVYRFDVYSGCAVPISCVGGGTACFPGAGTFEIGVTTISGSPSCSLYTLSISNDSP